MKNFEIRHSQRDTRVRYVFYPAAKGRMVKLSVHHRDGGQNYFSGGVETRGIEISLSTIELANSGFSSGGMMETSMPMSEENGRLLIVESPRYSAKKLEAIVELLDDHASEICAMWSVDRNGTVDLIRSITQGAGLRKAA